MFKTFIILKYFHIQTSAIKRKYPTLIVRIFFVSACTHSISRYIHIQTLCVHKRNVPRFLQHGTYHVVVRGGSHFCQSPKGGGGIRSVFIKMQGRANTFLGKKSQNCPALPPPRKNVPSPRMGETLTLVFKVAFVFCNMAHLFSKSSFCISMSLLLRRKSFLSDSTNRPFLSKSSLWFSMIFIFSTRLFRSSSTTSISCT